MTTQISLTYGHIGGTKLPNTPTPPNRDAAAAQRAALAISLRASKMTYAKIAQHCGYSDASACRKAVLRELNRVVVTNIDELRHEELSVLDRMHQELWALAMDRKNKYRLGAFDRLLALSERRCKLMGLDMKADELPHADTLIREYEAEVSKV